MVRLSPSDSATKFKIGHKKIGNDGNMWVIVANKNGVNRWERVGESGDVQVFNNKKASLHLSKQWGESSGALLASSVKWANYLTPIATELLNYGVILLIHPMGYYYSDYAEADVESYIVKNKKIMSFYENFHGTKIVKAEFAEDTLKKLSYIYYLAVNDYVSELCLKHKLASKKVHEDCYAVFKKHAGRGLNWNKSPMRAICVTLPGHKKKKEISFTQVFVKKLKKDVGAIKVLDWGALRRNGKITPTKIDIGSIDQKKLEKKLKGYGMLKINLKKNAVTFVAEDEFLIVPDQNLLFVNFIEGISGFIYNRIKE